MCYSAWDPGSPDVKLRTPESFYVGIHIIISERIKLSWLKKKKKRTYRLKCFPPSLEISFLDGLVSCYSFTVLFNMEVKEN